MKLFAICAKRCRARILFTCMYDAEDGIDAVLLCHTWMQSACLSVHAVDALIRVCIGVACLSLSHLSSHDVNVMTKYGLDDNADRGRLSPS